MNPYEPVEVNDATLIRTKVECSTFRAQLVRPVDHMGERAEEFLDEVEAYETGAKTLQGDIVPFFDGMFQTNIGSALVTCLITQYCGDSMADALYDSDRGFVSDLVKMVDRLHGPQSLSLGGLNERNIIIHKETGRLF
ncbi:hypothetical protein C8J57DRAFT_1480128 [Mycena rebaudengoi]|nr:hypothetical protein C8J57DRAFT_1480128 [Mycena rebaudengoi]